MGTSFTYRLVLHVFFAFLALIAIPVHAVTTAVPTFHSIGLYWSPAGADATTSAQIQFRPTGTSAWRAGLNLWYDARTVGARTPEFRGSLIELKPGTSYDIQLTLVSSSGAVLLTENLQASTWSETFPVDPSKVHYLPPASSA